MQRWRRWRRKKLKQYYERLYGFRKPYYVIDNGEGPVAGKMRYRDTDHLESYEGTPCECRTKVGETVGAHIRFHDGIGRKPDDWYTMGLCSTCHHDFDHGPLRTRLDIAVIVLRKCKREMYLAKREADGK